MDLSSTFLDTAETRQEKIEILQELVDSYLLKEILI